VILSWGAALAVRNDQVLEAEPGEAQLISLGLSASRL